MWTAKEVTDVIHEGELFVAALTGLNCALQSWRTRIHRKEDRAVADDTNEKVDRILKNGHGDSDVDSG